MIRVRPRGDVQQARGLKQMHPMPFPFWNDAGIPGAQFDTLIRGGLHRNGHASGKDQDELIAIRMAFAGMRRIARHVRDTNIEPVDPRMRTSLVRDPAHTQIPADRNGV